MSMTEELELASQGAVCQAGSDPYLYHAEMPFRAVYYPLGFPLELVTNSKRCVGCS